jgi:hypothetical protein
MKILQASISENGTTGNSGDAKKGDQRNELNIRDWYDKPWSYVIRHPDSNIGIRAAITAYKLYYSRLVGYDQSQRNTLYAALKSNGFDVDKYINSGVKTETDCSAYVYAAYAVHVPTIRSDGNAPSTHDMADFYKRHGFIVYNTSDYTHSVEKLKIGDILVKPASHAVLVVGDMPMAYRNTPVLNFIRSVMGESKHDVDSRKIGIYKTKTALNLRTSPMGEVVKTAETGDLLVCYGEYTTLDGNTWLHGYYLKNNATLDVWYRRSYTDKIT